MKNIQGTEENLDLFNKNSDGDSYNYIRVYAYRKDSGGVSWECTYDSSGNIITYKDSNGFSSEYTRDSNGKILTYKNSNGYSYEYTMEELVNKLGNFKIKK